MQALLHLHLHPVSCRGWRLSDEWAVYGRILPDTVVFIPWAGEVAVMVGGDEQRLSPGRIAVLAEGQPHTVRLVPPCTEIGMMVVHVRCLGPDGVPAGLAPTVFDLPEAPRWLEDFRRIASHYTCQAALAGSELSALIRLLFVRLCEQGLAITTNAACIHPRIAPALAAARQDPSLTVASLARTCRVSEDRFRRLLHRSTGLAPKAWLDRQRLGLAADLLTGGDLSVAQVAQRCGFASARRLQVRFRAMYGCTPTMWRERQPPV